MPPRTLTIPRRFNGPPTSGNGGYVAGAIAACLPDPTVQITLRAPVPLDRPLQWREAPSGGITLHDGEQLLAEAAGSTLVQRQIERVATLPFASPNGFVMLCASGAHARDALVVAQSQHRAVLDAITRREAARADAVMQEHARRAHANLREALQSQQGLQRLPGARLIRHAGR